MIRLVVFDVDDTLRRTVVPGQPCPHAPGEWDLLPGVARRLRRERWIAPGDRGPGLFLGAASNQDHVGYGLLSHELAVRLIGDALEAALGRPVPEAAIEICPHLPAAGCGCRKPAPGMLLALLRRFDVSPREALFVGNATCDREAAERAGIAFADARSWFADQP